MDRVLRWVSRHLGRLPGSDPISRQLRMFPGDGIAPREMSPGQQLPRQMRTRHQIADGYLGICNVQLLPSSSNLRICNLRQQQLADRRRSSRHSRRQQCSISVGGRSWSELLLQIIHFSFTLCLSTCQLLVGNVSLLSILRIVF